jgi:hypothetical protein
VSRRLPSAARDALRAWQTGSAAATELAKPDVRAHQRLLREFVREHVMSDDRPLRAFAAWETDFGALAG